MIRKIKEEDKAAYFEMAKDFYSSDAVYRNVPEDNFAKTFRELMRSDVYTVCYILEHHDTVAGYALLARTFSQEAGGMVLWIEELYVKPEYRCCGLGHEFFAYLHSNLPEGLRRIRIEAEDDNKRAISLYRQYGFEDLPYSQLTKDF